MTPNKLPPSRVKFWKKRIPTSLRSAIDESLAYAQEAYNLNVHQIAERMGYGSHWTLYKALADMNLKLTQVRMFEHACHIDLLSRYFAASAGRLVIESPTGANVTPDDIQHLQMSLTDAVSALLAFYSGLADTDTTIQAVTAAMSELAGHRGNVQKHAAPELQLEMPT